MARVITCPVCGKLSFMPDHMAGQVVKCVECRTELHIPPNEVPVAATPAAATPTAADAGPDTTAESTFHPVEFEHGVEHPHVDMTDHVPAAHDTHEPHPTATGMLLSCTRCGIGHTLKDVEEHEGRIICKHCLLEMAAEGHSTSTFRGRRRAVVAKRAKSLAGVGFLLVLLGCGAVLYYMTRNGYFTSPSQTAGTQPSPPMGLSSALEPSETPETTETPQSPNLPPAPGAGTALARSTLPVVLPPEPSDDLVIPRWKELATNPRPNPTPQRVVQPQQAPPLPATPPAIKVEPPQPPPIDDGPSTLFGDTTRRRLEPPIRR